LTAPRLLTCHLRDTDTRSRRLRLLRALVARRTLAMATLRLLPLLDIKRAETIGPERSSSANVALPFLTWTGW